MKKREEILVGKVLVTLLAFSTNYAIVGHELAEKNFEKIYTFLPHISAFLSSIVAQPFKTILLLLLLLRFFKITGHGTSSVRKCIAVEILAWTASIGMFVGNAVYKYEGLESMFLGIVQSIKSLIIVGGYYFFFQKMFFLILCEYENFMESREYCLEYVFFNRKYAGRIVFLSLLMVWGCVLFVYYPAVFMGDSEDILYMAFNYPTGLVDSVVLPREGIYLTNHHPIVYTAFVRMIMEIVGKIGGGYKCSNICVRDSAVYC